MYHPIGGGNPWLTLLVEGWEKRARLAIKSTIGSFLIHHQNGLFISSITCSQASVSGGDHQDLRQWMAEVSGHQRIPPLPQVKPYEPVACRQSQRSVGSPNWVFSKINQSSLGFIAAFLSL